MPKRTIIDGLAEPLRRELDERLIASGFSGYEALAEWLLERGIQISKSAIHRHGSQLQAQHDEAMAAARELLALTRASGELGEAGAELSRHSAMILQTDIVKMSLEIRREENVEKRTALLSKLTRAHADIGRMVISADKWKVEEQARIREQERTKAAEAATTVAKDAGASPEMIAKIRSALGVVV